MIPGATAAILRTLETFGFEWDDEVVYQSRRVERYRAALDALSARGLTFECSCSRSQLAEEDRYPGHCRERPLDPALPTATRLRVEPRRIEFDDGIQGRFRQDVAAAVGDVVLRRRDRLIAYLLAVVVDDAAQGVTQVLRGADLLDNTPRQIYLQDLLALPRPGYAHVPVLAEADGRKLAKSARSVGLRPELAVPQLVEVFGLLGMDPPAGLRETELATVWRWAKARWAIGRVPRRLTHRLAPNSA